MTCAQIGGRLQSGRLVHLTGASPRGPTWGLTEIQSAERIGPQTPGDSGLGMNGSGTSPSIDSFNAAFQANTGNLWRIGPCCPGGGDTGVGMMTGTSPSIDENGDFAAQDTDNDLVLSSIGTALASLMAGTSPSINHNGDIAFQGAMAIVG
jgi:hypothetical protein